MADNEKDRAAMAKTVSRQPNIPEVGSIVRVKLERIARLLGARRARVVRIDKGQGPVYTSAGDLIEYQEKIYAIVLQPQGKRRLTYWGPRTFWDYFAPAQQQGHKTRGEAPLLASAPSGVQRYRPATGEAKEGLILGEGAP